MIDLSQEIERLESALNKLKELSNVKPVKTGLHCPLCNGSIRRAKFNYICQQDNGTCGNLFLTYTSKRQRSPYPYDSFFRRTKIEFTGKLRDLHTDWRDPAMHIRIVMDKIIEVNLLNGWPSQ